LAPNYGALMTPQLNIRAVYSGFMLFSAFLPSAKFFYLSHFSKNDNDNQSLSGNKMRELTTALVVLI